MKRTFWLAIALGTAAACGPDARPEEPCNGPSFNLVVRAEKGHPLPSDTRINVHYGANQDGEPYALGEKNNPQAVRCTEDTSPGGAPSTETHQAAAGEGGAPSTNGSDEVWALRCLLYTQGPARLDVTATGYEPVDNLLLSLERKERCDVDFPVRLQPLKPDESM